MEERSERGWKKKKLFYLFIFNWVSSVCTFNITLREPERKAMESWYLPPSQGLESHLMILFWVLSEVVGLLRRMDPIPYLVKRQDAAVTQTTFYGVAGLKSLANHWLRLYHTHKVWCESTDEGLIECAPTLPPYFTSAWYPLISKLASFYSEYDLETSASAYKGYWYFCCSMACLLLDWVQ